MMRSRTVGSWVSVRNQPVRSCGICSVENTQVRLIEVETRIMTIAVRIAESTSAR